MGLQDHGLRWTHAPDVLTHLLPDGRAATVNRDLAATMASMEQFAPGDGERWKQRLRRLAGDLRSSCSTRCSRRSRRSRAGARPGPAAEGRRRAAAGPPTAAVGARAGLGDVPGRGRARWRWPAARCTPTCRRRRPAAACTAGCSPCSARSSAGRCRSAAPSRSPTALVARLAVSGRPDRLSGARSSRILVARGRAMGVRTADGRDWRARRAVLADVPGPGAVPGPGRRPAGCRPRFVEDLRALPLGRRHGQGGLGGVGARSRGRTRPRPAPGTVHLGADLNGLTRYAAQLATDADADRTRSC